MPVDRAIYLRLAQLPASLPRRPWLAFSARAVRRLQPMLQIAWPTIPQHISALVEESLTQVEHHTTGGKRPKNTRASVESLCFQYEAGNCGSGAVAAVLNDVAMLLSRCRARTLSWYPPGVDRLYYFQFPWITGPLHDDMIRLHLLSMSQDLDALLDASQQQRWTADTVLPSEFFGEIWPFG